MTQKTSSETLDQLCERFPAVKALREDNAKAWGMARSTSQLSIEERKLQARIKELESQLAELRQGGEAMIQELRDLQSRIHFDPLPRFNVPDEIDRIIDNFRADADFPQPAIPPGYAVVSHSTLNWWKELAIINPSDLIPRIDAMLAKYAPSQERDA